MEDLLPLVKPEVGLPIARMFSGANDENIIALEMEKIALENPMIEKFIESFSTTTNDTLGSKFCGVLVYKMLRNQSEADKMNAAWGL